MNSRHELTLPLRVGPWWVGILMVIPLLPLMVVGVFCDTFGAFAKSARENGADLLAAVEVIWADRK